jgi:hypothetical protein
MRTKTYVLLLCLSLVISGFLCSLSLAFMHSRMHYTIPAVVQSIDNDNTVVFEDAYSNLWTCVCYNVVVSQPVTLRIYTNKTIETNSDDYIVNVKPYNIDMD